MSTVLQAPAPADLVADLDEVRGRSVEMLAPLPDEVMLRQHSPLMSPLVWDLAHVANYEHQWLVRALTGEAPERPELDDLYDAFRHARADRHALAMLGPAEARAYGRAVRDRVIDVLPGLDLGDEAAPLTRRGFVHRMVVQHEHQHDETMLAALQLLPAPGYRPVAAAPLSGGGSVPAEVLMPGGAFTMGTSGDPWALDNERPAREATVAPFWLETTAVTNGAYAGFVGDGGYHEPRHWSTSGWAWRNEAGLEHPQGWIRDGSGWLRNRFGWTEPLPPADAVQHVCWYEADAYARWAGKRLPTEEEWEYAASWSPEGRKRRWPWGDEDPTADHASLWLGAAGDSAFSPGPASAHPDGANPWGVRGLIGGTWEWTSSDFGSHPGFRAWPYREYSEVFFGTDYKVLRGGSWATHPSCLRSTFRNWDYPIRRQIFSGFRCARSA
jgi:iron(II)-dependent oxidoreductase